MRIRVSMSLPSNYNPSRSDSAVIGALVSLTGLNAQQVSQGLLRPSTMRTVFVCEITYDLDFSDGKISAHDYAAGIATLIEQGVDIEEYADDGEWEELFALHDRYRAVVPARDVETPAKTDDRPKVIFPAEDGDEMLNKVRHLACEAVMLDRLELAVELIQLLAAQRSVHGK